MRRRTPISIPSFALLLSVLILISGCRRAKEIFFGEKVEEGVVHYDVTFPYAKKEGLMASMLPNKMTMKFEEGRYVTELTAGMGMFRMRFISNTKDKILYHTLDMMDDKKMVEMNEDGARKMLKSFPKLKILDEQGTDSLAGLPCKRALGFFAPSDEPPMEIYHTDRIALKEPNWCNQFHELKGVLLGYEVMRFGKRMRLRATQVEAKEIPEKAFTTDKYEQVSVEEMNRTMEKLMESLN